MNGEPESDVADARNFLVGFAEDGPLNWPGYDDALRCVGNELIQHSVARTSADDVDAG